MPGGLELPDVLTEADIFNNFDMSALFSQPLDLGGPNDKRRDVGLDWNSTLNPEVSTQSRLTPEDRPQLEDDTGLELDLGEDVPLFGNDTSMSIEVGRNAPAARSAAEDLFSDDHKLMDGDNLDLDLGEDVPMPDRSNLAPRSSVAPFPADDLLGQNEPIDFGAEDTIGLNNDDTMQARAHRSESPLSEAPSDLVRELDQTFANEDEADDEAGATHAQRSKKRKALVADAQTVLKSQQIKDQQTDRSKVLKPSSFLPRDPLLLTLMNMQKSGEFVSNVMGEGRSRGWAPELRGLLSIDTVQGSRHLKRKRDSGVGDLSADEHADKTARIQLDRDGAVLDDEGIAVESGAAEQTQMELPGHDEMLPPIGMSDPLEPSALPPPSTEPKGQRGRSNLNSGEDEGIGHEEDEQSNDDEDDNAIYPDGNFDDTTIPLIHPADNGPISLGTKHAVHLLRDRFGGQSSDDKTTPSPDPKSKSVVLFQDLLPEGRATKEDATKMFFETLVLATKDALKVEQVNVNSKRKASSNGISGGTDAGAGNIIGAPIRIRAKRGLWGSWVEGENEDRADVRE